MSLIKNTQPTRYELYLRKADPLFASWFVKDGNELHPFDTLEEALILFLTGRT